ncbi:MAG: cell envelope integrity protein TolA [Prolixibacteraceae bacterium]|nr:cell envelope integrity protein TolA [Prolixibacteraceae bacterium]
MGEYFSEHREGIIGTIIFHVILILILIFFKLAGIFPPPGEEGILVEFGNSNIGRGTEQPAARRVEPEPTRQEPRVVPVTPPSQPVQTPPAKPVEQSAITQDLEETAALQEAKKKQEEEARRQKQLEDERKRIEQQEAEKQRLAELERQRKEAEEKKRQEEEARRVAEIESRTRDAFGRTDAGASTGSGTGQSQGVTYPGGNQGSPTGSSGAQGQGGSGSGTQGKGPSYSLSGRTATTLPSPNYPGREEGIVVVNITVDKFGNVTQASAGARGSTTMNQQLLDAARKAALQAKFNSDNSVAAYQNGTITYRFTLTD